MVEVDLRRNVTLAGSAATSIVLTEYVREVSVSRHQSRRHLAMIYRSQPPPSERVIAQLIYQPVWPAALLLCQTKLTPVRYFLRLIRQHRLRTTVHALS